MKIIIEVEAKEIAALVLASQGQQKDCQSNISNKNEEERQKMIAFLEARINKLRNNQPII